MRQKGDRTIKRMTYFGTELACGLNEVGKIKKTRALLSDMTEREVAHPATVLPSLHEMKEPKLRYNLPPVIRHMRHISRNDDEGKGGV